jgi:putative SOS response-associated peptidase YedK
MCGRFVLFAEEEYQDMQNILDQIDQKNKANSGEIFPTNYIPVVVDHGGGPELDLFKWGFPKFGSGGVIINARGETIEEKSMFRKSFHTKRCLIPANAFYEWAQDTQPKAKFEVGLQGKPKFHMGGIYNTFKGADGSVYNGFVIITIAANTIMSKIHSRMPVILEPWEEDIWLNPASDMGKVRELVDQYESEKMYMKQVRPYFAQLMLV